MAGRQRFAISSMQICADYDNTERVVRPNRRAAILMALLAVFVLALSAPVLGQADGKGTGQAAPAALVIAGKRVLTLYSRVGAFSADERIEAARLRLQGLLKDPAFGPESIRDVESLQGTDIVSGNTLIVTVTDADAAAAGEARQQLARE